jgi:NAD+ kinase
MLLVPISAHALFARPLVVGPESRLAVELLTEAGGAIAFCDGRRTTELALYDRVEIGRGHLPVRLVRLSGATFTDRLVGKFKLPVRGWRGHTEEDRPED